MLHLFLVRQNNDIWSWSWKVLTLESSLPSSWVVCRKVLVLLSGIHAVFLSRSVHEHFFLHLALCVCFALGPVCVFFCLWPCVCVCVRVLLCPSPCVVLCCVVLCCGVVCYGVPKKPKPPQRKQNGTQRKSTHAQNGRQPHKHAKCAVAWRTALTTRTHTHKFIRLYTQIYSRTHVGRERKTQKKKRKTKKRRDSVRKESPEKGRTNDGPVRIEGPGASPPKFHPWGPHPSGPHPSGPHPPPDRLKFRFFLPLPPYVRSFLFLWGLLVELWWCLGCSCSCCFFCCFCCLLLDRRPSTPHLCSFCPSKITRTIVQLMRPRWSQSIVTKFAAITEISREHTLLLLPSHPSGLPHLLTMESFFDMFRFLFENEGLIVFWTSFRRKNPTYESNWSCFDPLSVQEKSTYVRIKWNTSDQFSISVGSSSEES